MSCVSDSFGCSASVVSLPVARYLNFKEVCLQTRVNVTMGRSLVSAFFLLLAGVQAVPGSLDLRCHHDKCYREVCMGRGGGGGAEMECTPSRLRIC